MTFSIAPTWNFNKQESYLLKCDLICMLLLFETSTNHVLKYMCLCLVFNFQEKTKKQLLYEISICLTKEFELISCNKKEVSETTCPRKEPFFYPPVHDNFPQIDISVIWLAYLPFCVHCNSKIWSFLTCDSSQHLMHALCMYHCNNITAQVFYHFHFWKLICTIIFFWVYWIYYFLAFKTKLFV